MKLKIYGYWMGRLFQIELWEENPHDQEIFNHLMGCFDDPVQAYERDNLYTLTLFARMHNVELEFLGKKLSKDGQYIFVKEWKEEGLK